MRYVLAVLLVAVLVPGWSRADATRSTIGDIPRTYSHYMNAQEAALCRANAAVGGLAAYFFNPASAIEVEGVGGQATIRLNVKTRSYLPDGDEYLDSDDDGILFSHAVAAKRSGTLVLGFGYACPSYRRLQLTGMQDDGDRALRAYEGEFTGGLRFFEAIFGARIGTEGQAALGIAAGIVNLDESARETLGQTLDYADLSGVGASLAAGFLFNATERLAFGLGYRWGSEIDLDGSWYESERDGEQSNTVPVAVAGVRYSPIDDLTVYAGYVREGWDEATADLATYVENEGRRDEFDEALGTAALGVEITLLSGKMTARAGASKQFAADIENAIVPSYSVGVGAAMAFEQYFAELSVVREQFDREGLSNQVTNYGVYTTIGYAF
jgi:hypothetical protein